MDEFLKEHWDVMAASPLTFVLFAIVVGGAVFTFARVVFGAALDASRERFEGARDEAAPEGPER